MSSSANSPDWSTFRTRPTRTDPDFRSPVAELAAVLQMYHADLETAHAAADAAGREGYVALARQAMLATQLGAALARYEAAFTAGTLGHVFRHLRVLKDQMLDAVGEAGLTVVSPFGWSFDMVASVVQIDGWRHHPDFTAEQVAEVIEPIIYAKGTLIRLGRVIMGAPPSSEPAASGESPSLRSTPDATLE